MQTDLREPRRALFPLCLSHEIHNILRPEQSIPSVYCDPREEAQFKSRNCEERSQWQCKPVVRLGIAIRFFAGGSVYEIMTTFGVGRADVSKSIWAVVEAINQHEQLAIRFPTNHDEQKELAWQLQEKLDADFDCCVGAVDGILIWIQQPSDADANVSECGTKKFWCGRKHKFGLNCQAICDAKGKFLDISVLFPASTSDVLAFESSTIYSALMGGLLAPGLCLFGDNAYINTSFMATPFSGASASIGLTDAYNIECAFGRFVHCWSILRSPMPINFSIQKTSALVVAMAKLHNFCIDRAD